MASNNNNSGGGFVLIILLIAFGYVAYILFVLAIIAAMAAYAVVLFASIVLTLLSVFAAYRGLGFCGIHVSPIHARLFLGRGVAGAILAPSFVWFATWYYGLPVERWLWPHIAFGGYALASTGIFFLDSDGGASFVEDLIELQAGHTPQIAPPRRELAYGVEEHKSSYERDAKKKFTFATWDDEEGAMRDFG